MKKFKIVNSPVGIPGEVLLKESNPYPKNLVKDGLVKHNPLFDAFENQSIRNAIQIVNPVPDKREYIETELKLSIIDDKRVFEFIGDKALFPEYDIIKVYVASPYTIGDVAVNVKAQMEAADKLMNLGFAPFIPLYSHFQHMMFPRPYQDWIKIDKVWVLSCDALYRFGGESKGADGEVELAIATGIPVFYDIESLVEYFKK